MPRKPIEVEFIGGKSNRQRTWEHIRATKGDTFKPREIARAAKVDIETVYTYVQCLIAAGYVEHRERETLHDARHRGVAKTLQHYALVRDAGIEAPRVKRDGTPHTQGLGQEQMWRSLRMLKADLDAAELAAHATTALVRVTVIAAADYLRTLHAAGYLDVTADAKLGKNARKARYRLKPGRNTGPRPPMICRTQVVYDPNEGRVVWQREVTEEDAA